MGLPVGISESLLRSLESTSCSSSSSVGVLARPSFFHAFSSLSQRVNDVCMSFSVITNCSSPDVLT